MAELLSTLLAVASVGLVLAFVRLLKGPRLPDRVVALEVLTSIGLTLIALFALLFDQPVVLDVLVVVALVGFVGTVAFARYLERRPSR